LSISRTNTDSQWNQVYNAFHRNFCCGNEMIPGKTGKQTCFDVGKIRFCHCAAVLTTKEPRLCTALDLSLLYILILGTYSKFAWKNNFLALGVCFPQFCSSAGRRLPRQDHVYKSTDESVRFHNKKIDEIRCKLYFTENPRSFEKYPTPL